MRVIRHKVDSHNCALRHISQQFEFCTPIAAHFPWHFRAKNKLTRFVMCHCVRLHINCFIGFVLVKLQKTARQKKLVLDVRATMTNVAKKTAVHIFTEWRFNENWIVWMGLEDFDEIVAAAILTQKLIKNIKLRGIILTWAHFRRQVPRNQSLDGIR